ncbi:MAG: bifunctional adenosylcobinamide kinase/adenosylcobinamide-phosphate guanylyltransferase [Synergistaceae bacterium]|nr:bifunctional adenosylcobinamide kinase/adenosylcobinamide-phosphate guanylyltransferase [Synergistaceae bacterium]MBQ3627052.1 bifunctional adenosylcobinamide kinase/adenosylcobinamide-phosphate guanylyltransferase [Synergistaceae bacterium]MBQ4419603.1 bifunctional adenosylcobinamide kinase/adenosylcobinamide-phosphate guanylyltransferase [Synergistaceae bacterium]MBQ6739585.1 bifunctional adenosylcobinamide kinase/adenosylcobinamide-phosphate guanylyltransferase [Synergistaceae bacterium]M
MFIFISGASRSGKSEFAENICGELAADNRKIYLATAQVYDEDMRRRVERHRAMRKNKNFITLEKTHNLHEIFDLINKDDNILLECLPNLAANELFIDESIKDLNFVKAKIFNEILELNFIAKNLIVVSDDIFSDGIIYDGMTENYIKLLGELHCLIAAQSDKAIECASGLAYYFK